MYTIEDSINYILTMMKINFTCDPPLHFEKADKKNYFIKI